MKSAGEGRTSYKKVHKDDCADEEVNAEENDAKALLGRAGCVLCIAARVVTDGDIVPVYEVLSENFQEREEDSLGNEEWGALGRVVPWPASANNG